MFNNKNILITGGTGSFGKKCVEMILKKYKPNKLIVFSRDELKQFEMGQIFSEKDTPVRFLLGDIRDRERLYRAFNGVDYVIHAAALKQVPAAERNPFEVIKTNILGAENIINAAIDNNVDKVIALSTDKAASPINLYGATKLCSDKLFIAGNSYSGMQKTRFSVVRYGNVIGSRGSVIPFFLKLRDRGVLPITDERMTRFFITLEQGVDFVLDSMKNTSGGELFVPKIPSMKIIDLANVLAPECKHEIIGIRPGEKIHEVLLSVSDSRNAIEYSNFFIVKPEYKWWSTSKELKEEGIAVGDGFSYTSNNNDSWVKKSELLKMIKSINI